MPVPTEQMLKAILDHSPQNIVLMDRDHKVICYNERIRQTLFAYHGRYINAGDDYRDFVVEMAMPTYLSAFEKALHGDITLIDLETVAEDFRIWFHYRVNPVYDSAGELLGVSLSAEDINQRKLAQQELLESETKFRTLVEQSSVGVFMLQDGKIVYVNPAFETTLAMDPSKAVQDIAIADFIHDDDIAAFNQSCQNILSGTQTTDHLVLSAVRTDGAVRSLQIDISPIRYKGHPVLLGSALDITDRLDEEMRINEAMDRGQEIERAQIGMELHDNVKQQLVAISLTLQQVQERFSPNQSGFDLLQKSISYLHQAVTEVRKLSHRLAPAVDEETRLPDKLRDLVERMNVKGELQVDIDIDAHLAQSNPTLQLAIYRIIQEQFSNIIKYAKASHVFLHVYGQANNVIVRITDNGKGANLSAKTRGVGLQNIRRRVQALGGNVQIQSAPGEGFALVASLPL